MKKLTYLFLLMALTSCSSTVLAADDYQTEIYDQLSAQCIVLIDYNVHQADYIRKGESGVTADILDDQGTFLDCQDDYFNKLYVALIKKLDKQPAQDLTDAERKWIKVRETTCGLVIDLTAGTYSSILYNECMIQATNNRIGELEMLMSVVTEY